MKINLDTIKSILLDVPIGIGALAGLLQACGVDLVTTGKVTGIVAAGAILGLWGVGAVKRAFNQTDAGKAATIERLDPAGKAAVLDHLPDQTKIAAVNALEDVKLVITKDTATDGVAIATHDPSLEKVVSETQTQVH